MVEMVAVWLKFYLIEHPTIVNFRWTDTHYWGSTWPFLITSIVAYAVSALLLNLILTKRRRPVPLGPLPALHSLVISLVSTVIFAGLSLSTVAEIRDTRWLWRKSKTPIQWLVCFPLGIRPSGPVFFWSYAFYISRFLLLPRTFFAVLRRRPHTGLRVVHHSVLIFMSFLWLEFTQSFQVVAILSTTMVYSVMYGYRFWTGVGWPAPCLPNCQLVLLTCFLVANGGVLLLHFRKEGCKGIGAWVFNAFLTLLLLFLNLYVQMRLRITNSMENMQQKPPSSNFHGGRESAQLEMEKKS